MEMQADVTNMPRISSLDNAFFPTMQLNVVAARKQDDVQSKSAFQRSYSALTHVYSAEFMNDLSTNAGRHRDKLDSPGALTCLISYYELEPLEEPGFVILADIGFAVCEFFFFVNPQHVLNAFQPSAVRNPSPLSSFLAYDPTEDVRP